MNDNLLSKILGTHCEQVSDGLIYATTHLALPSYGNAIGGYIQELGNNRVRISDNADTLFEAITHGVEHSNKRANTIKQTVESFGLQLSDAGEITATCNLNELDYFFARFVEASFAVANVTLDWQPATNAKQRSAFKKQIDAVLTREYKERVTKNAKVIGGTGHQLTFHFVIDAEQPQEKLIQTVGLTDGGLDWNTVYSTLGKMIDVSRIRDSKRIVVIENANADDIVSASTLLGEKASIIPFVDDARLLKALAA